MLRKVIAKKLFKLAQVARPGSTACLEGLPRTLEMGVVLIYPHLNRDPSQNLKAW